MSLARNSSYFLKVSFLLKKEAKEKAEKEAKEKAEKETKDSTKVESEKTEVPSPSNVSADSEQPSETVVSPAQTASLECDVESVSADESIPLSGSICEKWVAVSPQAT